MSSTSKNNLIDSTAYGGLPEDLRYSEMDPLMQNELRNGVMWVGIAILGIAAFSIISFVGGAPFVLTVLINAWFAGSAIYLSGIGYCILNDLIGVKKNLPYFSLGHQDWQKALIKSNDRAAVGIAWGIFASKGFSLIAAVLFTIATLVTGFLGLPFAGFVLPVLAAVLPITLVAAHLYSRHKEKQREQAEQKTHYLAAYKKLIDQKNHFMGLNAYQMERLKHWLKDTSDMNAWLGNSDRNVFGFISMPLVGVAGLVAIITLSAVSSFLPAILFGAAFSAFPPVGLGILLAVGIAAACVYLYLNHKKIVNNGYRLDAPNEPAPSQDEQASSNQRLDSAFSSSPVLPSGGPGVQSQQITGLSSNVESGPPHPPIKSRTSCRSQ